MSAKDTSVTEIVTLMQELNLKFEKNWKTATKQQKNEMSKMHNKIQQIMKPQVMWSVASRYYKHGEAELMSFKTEDELRKYLEEEIENYSDSDSDSDSDSESEDSDIEYLIEKAVRLGNETVENERGWGIVAIHKLDFGNNTIKKYED